MYDNFHSYSCICTYVLNTDVYRALTFLLGVGGRGRPLQLKYCREASGPLPLPP